MKNHINSKEQALFITGQSGRLEALLFQFPEEKEEEEEKEADLPEPTMPVTTGVRTSKMRSSKMRASKMRSSKIGIVCHPHPLHQGSMQNKVVTTIVKAWQELGMDTLRFNFRGVGLSEGEYGNGEGEQEDLKSVLDWVLQQYPNPEICLGGFSFGAFISAKIAAQNGQDGQNAQKAQKAQNEHSLPNEQNNLKYYPLRALLSVAPPLRFFSFAMEKLPAIPWIIIQGDKDELVDYEEVVAWYHEIKSRKSDVQLITFKDTTHFFHGKLIELKNEIMNALKSYF